MGLDMGYIYPSLKILRISFFFSGGIFKGALQDSRNEDLAQKFYSSILVKWKDKGWCGAEILGLNPDGLRQQLFASRDFFCKTKTIVNSLQ